MGQIIEMRQALNQAMDEEMQANEDVFILGEEVAYYHGAYKVTKGLLEKYGDKRVVDTPITEGGFSGLAIGAAMTGLRPIVEFMSWNFSFVAADQLISNACKIHYMSGGRFNVPIVFRGANGAAAEVAAQHSHSVAPVYSNFPGFIIISPSNAYDAKGLLKTAIRDNNPVLFLENEILYGDKMEIPDEPYYLPIGKAHVMQEGSDVTLISYSRTLKFCQEAANELKKQGVSVELIDLRTIKPLDIPCIVNSVKKTNFCVLVEEGHKFSGISAEIGFTIMNHCFDYLDAPIKRVCQREAPMPYSKPLEIASLPSVERIIKAIKDVLSIK
jgi:pyruvate dehydrogenase E1 component beta subunit